MKKLLRRLPRSASLELTLTKGNRTHRLHVKVFKPNGDCVVALADHPKTADLEVVLGIALKQARGYLAKPAKRQ